MKNAERTLNKDHYGLEKVKERILEHLAVLKLKNNAKSDMKSPIICPVWPSRRGQDIVGAFHSCRAEAQIRAYVLGRGARRG